jgi:flagellar assembly factor FliW
MSEQIDLTPYLGTESPPIEFPGGLVGFPEWTRFSVLAHPQGDPLRLLQSLDNRLVSFILADPALILAGYRIGISEADARAIGYDSALTVREPWPSSMRVFCILSVQEDPFSVTANLLGPLVLNLETGLGRQLVLSDSGYDSHHPITSHVSGRPGAGQAADNGSQANGGRTC